MDRALTPCDLTDTNGHAAKSEKVLSAPAVSTLSVPGMMCGICISRIEDALNGMEGVRKARASLSQRRVLIEYDESRTGLPEFLSEMQKAGFDAVELREDDSADAVDHSTQLLPRVGVAGFAAANIMLLSVSVWSGSASDMDESVRSLFHWLSALIALPAIAYAGMPFYSSAFSALRAGRLNMDVPISLGVLLATAMSFVQTWKGTEQVYFDAAITLLFFLLIGRLLDEQVRKRARGAAENLIGLRPALATVLRKDGKTEKRSVHDLEAGERILVAAGQRLPADGKVITGLSEIDESVITGETHPRVVRADDVVHAGTLNGPAALEIEVTAAGQDTLLSEVGRMMLAAEQGRGRYVRLADRAARIYAPAVHILGLLTFVGWMLAGCGWEFALTTAVSVLIITCPCALALAVPVVQIAATSRLFRSGVIVKAADGLERLAEIDTVVLDKTGTLTKGAIELRSDQHVPDANLARAASLAVSSCHPYAAAVARAARQRGLSIQHMPDVMELPGQGLSATTADGEIRLGSAAWAGADQLAAQSDATLWLTQPDTKPFGFCFVDQLREDAADIVGKLAEAGVPCELLSGDRKAAVANAAARAHIASWQAELKPQDKITHIQKLADKGRHVLMVGDGLNDAPALAAAHASMSPASAVDISQAAADAVFQGDRLEPVVETLKVARAAQSLAKQNLGVALAYNAFFVPIAVSGFVTPLVAAIAMSTSSILVTLNSLRLHNMKLLLPTRTKMPKADMPQKLVPKEVSI